MIPEWWMATTLANAVMVVAYGAIAYHIGSGLTGTRQWIANPLAAATAGIFGTCAIGHGIHAFHTLEPLFEAGAVVGVAARASFSDPVLLGWDVATAAVAVWYWTLRGRFPIIVRGAALFDDLQEREREALVLNDNVVQGLAQAKLALEVGARDAANEALDRTVAASRTIISGLIGSPGSEAALVPGEFRRKRAPGGHPP